MRKENEKILTVKKTVRFAYRTEPMYQYDVGHVLQFEGFDLPASFKVHFALSKGGDAVTQIGHDDQVAVPDILVEANQEEIYAWLYIVEEDTGLTKFYIEMPLIGRAKPTDEEPTPVERSEVDQALSALNAGVERAEAASEAVQNLGVTASTLAPGSQATVTKVVDPEDGSVTLEFGIPEGEQGQPGEPGATPDLSVGTVSTLPAGSQATVTISGTQEAPVMNFGIPKGDPGTPADPTVLIDDTAGAGVTNKTWSANKLSTDVLSALTQKQDAPSSPGTAGQVLGLDSNLDPAWVDQTGGDESGLAPVIKSTASGEIASFADGADGRNIDSLIVNITPVQDLHGQDAPYPPGGGSNIWGGSRLADDINNAITAALDTTAKTIAVGTTAQPSGASDADCVFTNGITFEENAVYTLITDLATPIAVLNMMFKYTDGTTDRSLGRYTTPGAFKSASGKTVENLVYRSYSGTTVLNYEKCGLFKGDVAVSAFSPYSNICPISGWTEANVQADGKNLLNDDRSAYQKGAAYLTLANVVPDGAEARFTFSDKDTSIDVSGCYIGFFYAENVNRGYKWVVENGVIKQNTSNIANNGDYTGEYCSNVMIYPNTDECFNKLFSRYNIMVELGSTASSYSPYHGSTIPVSWETEAGTVYGGAVDVISGVLTVDRAMVDPTRWTRYNASNGYIAYQIIGLPKGKYNNDSQNLPMSNMISEFGSFSSSNMNKNIIQPPRASANAAYLALLEGLDPAVVQLSYLIEEPIVYQLTPNELTTLLGINNIWASCGSIESVVYSADTKTYVDDAIPAVPVQDVQVNGTSVLNNGVANVPIASSSALGVMQVGSGLRVSNSKVIINTSGTETIKTGTEAYNPIVPSHQHESVFYGLAKLAGANMAFSSNPVGTYTDAAKVAIRKMLGIQNNTWEKIGEYTVEEDCAMFTISSDNNGQPFELTQMLVKVWLKGATTGNRDYITANNLVKRMDGVTASCPAPTKRYLTAGAECYMQYESWIKGGNIITNAFSANTPGSTQIIEQINFANDNIRTIRGFRINQYNDTMTLIPAGTVIKIYGIRIDE